MRAATEVETPVAVVTSAACARVRVNRPSFAAGWKLLGGYRTEMPSESAVSLALGIQPRILGRHGDAGLNLGPQRLTCAPRIPVRIDDETDWPAARAEFGEILIRRQIRNPHMVHTEG
jgi:hypothetical protein